MMGHEALEERPGAERAEPIAEAASDNGIHQQYGFRTKKWCDLAAKAERHGL